MSYLNCQIYKYLLLSLIHKQNKNLITLFYIPSFFKFHEVQVIEWPYSSVLHFDISVICKTTNVSLLISIVQPCSSQQLLYSLIQLFKCCTNTCLNNLKCELTLYVSLNGPQQYTFVTHNSTFFFLSTVHLSMKQPLFFLSSTLYSSTNNNSQIHRWIKIYHENIFLLKVKGCTVQYQI